MGQDAFPMRCTFLGNSGVWPYVWRCTNDKVDPKGLHCQEHIDELSQNLRKS